MAVAHDEFKRIGLDGLDRYFIDDNNDKKVLIDVKGMFKVSDLEDSGYRYWRL